MTVHSFAEAKAAKRKVSPDVFHCIDCQAKGVMQELVPFKHYVRGTGWQCPECGRED